DAQRSSCGDKHRRNEAERHHHPATNFKRAVQADDAANVIGIALANVSQHFIADRIQVLLEPVQLFFIQFFHLPLLAASLAAVQEYSGLYVQGNRAPGYRNTQLDAFFTRAGYFSGQPVYHRAAGFPAAALMADAHAAAMLWFKAGSFGYFQQVCVAFGADFQVAAGERDFATELIVVELRLSWWRKECAVNLFISQAAPVQQIVGQIHQALR